MSLFTTCIITTATEERARVYRELIERRKEHGLYPAEIEFKVYSDPEGVKVGSGGATLLALESYSKELATGDSAGSLLQSKKILIIHAGGTGDVVPAYLPEGLLFTPVPVDSSSILSPVILDLQLNVFLKYPWQKGEIVVAPGDVVFDCDSTLLSGNRGDIHGFAVAAPYEKGAYHGVFRFDSYRYSVVGYFQKATVSFLKEQTSLIGTDQCAVDTGIVSFSSRFVELLLDFSNEPFNGSTVMAAIRNGVISFNLYLELLCSALQGATYTSFKEKVESAGAKNEEFLKLIFKRFSSVTLTATLAKNALFHHPDSMKGYLDLCSDLQARPVELWYAQSYAECGIKRSASAIIYNSHSVKMPLRKGNLVLVESVQNTIIENPLGNNIFTGLHSWETDSTIPEGVCVDRRRAGTVQVYCVYGITDLFAGNHDLDKLTLCGTPLKLWLEQRGLSPDDIGLSRTSGCLGDAHLFCTDASVDFISGYWYPSVGTQWTEAFRHANRYSLNQCSLIDTALERDDERTALRAVTLRKEIVNGHGWITISANDFKQAFKDNPPVKKLQKIHDETGDVLIRAYRKQLLTTFDHDVTESEPVGFLRREEQPDFLDTTFAVDSKSCVVVKCPVRVDIAGGWTDMPPFTLRYGGAVVNFAVNLFNTEPIQVYCRRSNEKVIRLVSIDKGTTSTIQRFSDVDQVCPECEVAAAVFKGLGFTDKAHGTLTALLDKLGGGVEVTTFCGVPQGSGLGVSSILIGAILKGLFGLFGKVLTYNKMLDYVISIEQYLRMGSGWQDLLGGAHGGIKLLQSKPGLIPETSVQTLNPGIIAHPDLARCFTLINTRITRGSRNPIREVASQMNENVPSYLFTLNYLKTLAVEAAEAVSTGNIISLADSINECRIANARIHRIDPDPAFSQLLDSCKRWFNAVKFTGAGGGGFALFLSDSHQSADILRKTIHSMGDNGPRVVDFSLNTAGMDMKVL